MKTCVRLASITAWIGGVFSIDSNFLIPIKPNNFVVSSSTKMSWQRMLKSFSWNFILFAMLLVKVSMPNLFYYWNSKASLIDIVVGSPTFTVPSGFGVLFVPLFVFCEFVILLLLSFCISSLLFFRRVSVKLCLSLTVFLFLNPFISVARSSPTFFMGFYWDYAPAVPIMKFIAAWSAGISWV